MNDAVAILIFRSVEQMVASTNVQVPHGSSASMKGSQLIGLFFNFVYLTTMSILIGIFFGLVCSFLFKKFPELDEFFHVLATSEVEGIDIVTAMEAKNYPFYGV